MPIFHVDEEVEAPLGKALAPVSPPHPAMRKPKLAVMQATETIKASSLRVDLPSIRKTTLLVEEVMVMEVTEEVLVAVVVMGMVFMVIQVMVVVVFMVMEVINQEMKPTEAVMGEGMLIMEVDTSTRIQTTKFLALSMLTVLVMEATVVDVALHFTTESKAWAYLHPVNPKRLATLQRGQRAEGLWQKWL